MQSDCVLAPGDAEYPNSWIYVITCERIINYGKKKIESGGGGGRYTIGLRWMQDTNR